VLTNYVPPLLMLEYVRKQSKLKSVGERPPTHRLWPPCLSPRVSRPHLESDDIMFAPSDHRPLGAHIWDREPDGFYVEPFWVSERLFEVEKFTTSVWDPCCGIGHIAESACRAGYDVFASDIVDRGYQHQRACLDFLQCDRPHGANFVFNPPFDHCEEFARHALSMIGRNDKSKVATIFLQRRLNAAHWLADLPRVHRCLLGM